MGFLAWICLPGEGPSRGLLCDCEIFANLRLKLYDKVTTTSTSTSLGGGDTVGEETDENTVTSSGDKGEPWINTFAYLCSGFLQSKLDIHENFAEKIEILL